MYERHFGLRMKPFSLTPDPNFLFASSQHKAAMTMLEYGIESQASFCLLTGEIGSGKTMLVRRVIRDLSERMVIGLISNAHRHFKSIHPWVLSSLSIVPSDDSDIAIYEALVDSFVRTYAAGRRTLLIIDEAQNLAAEVLEELRLLSNVNSEGDLVLQILLVGQPELRTKLMAPELRQFAQRVSVDFHLEPLDRKSTQAYVEHRLAVAGCEREIFSVEAIEMVHARTRGIPRLMNQLLDDALLYAYADDRLGVDAELLAQVLADRRHGVAMRHGGAMVNENGSR